MLLILKQGFDDPAKARMLFEFAAVQALFILRLSASYLCCKMFNFSVFGFIS